MAFDVDIEQDLAKTLSRALTIDRTDALVRRLGIPDDCDPSRGKPVSKEKRLQDLFAELSDERCLEFIATALNLEDSVYSTALASLLSERVGVKVVGKKGLYSLVPTDTSPADPGSAAQSAFTCLEAMGYTTASLHFQQAVSNFADRKWESANSQIRTALEAVLEAEVSRRGGTPVTGTGQMVSNADKLGSASIAQPLDSEIVAHVKTLIKVCHSDGSHPGAADGRETQFRLVSVAALIRFMTGC